MSAEGPGRIEIAAIAISVFALIVSALSALETTFDFFGIATPAHSDAAARKAMPFFEAFSTPSLDAFAQMAGFAQPKSPAYIYATVYYEEWQAYLAMNHSNHLSQYSVTRNGSTIKSCGKNGQCEKLTGFVFDNQSGLLTDFAVDGVPLRGRVFPAQAWNRSAGCLWYRIDGAVRFGTPERLRLAVTLHSNCSRRVRVATDNNFFYWQGHGRYVKPSVIYGKTTYWPVEQSVLVAEFPKAEFGGEFYLTAKGRHRLRVKEWISVQD